MDSDNPTPRVNFQAMQRFQGKRVLLACRVERVEGSRAIVTTSDGGEVFVNLGPGAKPFDTAFAEIVGTVVDPRTMNAEDHTNFGENFDLKMYNDLVTMSTGKYADMF